MGQQTYYRSLPVPFSMLGVVELSIVDRALPSELRACMFIELSEMSILCVVIQSTVVP